MTILLSLKSRWRSNNSTFSQNKKQIFGCLSYFDSLYSIKYTSLLEFFCPDREAEILKMNVNCQERITFEDIRSFYLSSSIRHMFHLSDSLYPIIKKVYFDNISHLSGLKAMIDAVYGDLIEMDYININTEKGYFYSSSSYNFGCKYISYLDSINVVKFDSLNDLKDVKERLHYIHNVKKNSYNYLLEIKNEEPDWDAHEYLKCFRFCKKSIRGNEDNEM